jgi:hypothetical protein
LRSPRTGQRLYPTRPSQAWPPLPLTWPFHNAGTVLHASPHGVPPLGA